MLNAENKIKNIAGVRNLFQYKPQILTNNNRVTKNNVGANCVRPQKTQVFPTAIKEKDIKMKATGIVRRIDDLGRVVIPKEIRRTMRIREGDPLQTTLTQSEKCISALLELEKRLD